MSKLKPVVEAVERTAKVIPPSAAVPSAPIGRQAARAQMDMLFKEHSDSIESMIKETEDLLTKKELDLGIGESDLVPDSLSIRAEEIRRQRILDPEANLEISAQTRTPEEYAERWHKQINNAGYAARSVLGIHDPTVTRTIGDKLLEEWTGHVRASIMRDISVQNKVSRSFKNNPRTMKYLEGWMEGSPYTRPGKSQPHVFFHVDRYSDPLTSNIEDMIQFSDDANELGLHSGTMVAAEGATIKTPEAGMQAHEAFADWIDELAGYTGKDQRELHVLVGDAITNFTERRFEVAWKNRQSIDLGDVFNDVEEFLGRSLVEEGLPVEDVFRNLRSIVRTLPIPDTTPHFFRGKNGLLMEDRGGWFPNGVILQLMEIFPEDRILLEAMARENKSIREYIESKGYDHVVYNNTVEDKGMPSIITWNPDLVMSLFDPRLVRQGGADMQAKATAGMVLGYLGIAPEEEE